MNLLEENYNDIKQIKEVINEIKYNQQKTIQIVEKNHKTNMKKIDDELEQVQGELAAQMKELKAEDDTVMASLNRLIEMVGR